MKSVKFFWKLTVTLVLLVLSTAFYTLHYLIFRDAHHIFIYMVGDVAFLFIDVLLVILVIEGLLERREKKAVFKKLNMVIGAFFSEVGLDLLRKFDDFVKNSAFLKKGLDAGPLWGRKDYDNALRIAREFGYEIQIDPEKLDKLQAFFAAKQPFLLRLLENPTLLEHERFTDLLWAVSHLSEELAYRGVRIRDLPETDLRHLNGDLKRAYSHLIGEWISYLKHLQESYPFLFSLAVRINPLGPQPSPIVL